jgi:hypothetical protein
VEGAKVGIALSPQDAQSRCDRASAGRQDGAREQQRDMRPSRAGEQFGEPREPVEKARRDGIRGVGEKMGMLHPIGRISALNRSNLVAVRQIESASPSILAGTSPIEHIHRYGQTRPDACPDRCSVHTPQRGKQRQRVLIVDRRTSNPVARLRPIPDTDRFELFYWSNAKGRWTTFGNMGRMKLMLESAREIVENDPMFRIPRAR